MKKELVIFIDSGDTLVNEETQVFDECGVVMSANLVEGAEELIQYLNREHYQVVLVADGKYKSFQNVYNAYHLWQCFNGCVISECIGCEKPDRRMFQTATQLLSLEEKDKRNIVMIGNNLKRDIAGANQFGITSIWMDWSPRYFHSMDEIDWEPDYTVHSMAELDILLRDLENKLENNQPIKCLNQRM